MRATIIIGIAALALGAACDKKDGEETGEPAAASEGDGPAKAEGLTEEETKALVDAVSIDGMEKGMKNATKGGFTLSFKGAKNDHGVEANVMASAIPCLNETMCPPLTVEVWEGNDRLKTVLSRAHNENPDLVFDIEKISAGGGDAIGVYALSYVETKTESGGTSRASANSYNIYWHDGATLLSVKASAGFSSARSAEELAEQMPKDALEGAADKVLTAIRAEM